MTIVDRSVDNERSTAPAGKPSTVLQAAGLRKSYRRGIWPVRQAQPVLRGVDLRLGAGEVVGLVGENGSGKSNLMKILIGALAPDRATVIHAGRFGYCPLQSSASGANSPAVVAPR